jgi:hypothetical protein
MMLLALLLQISTPQGTHPETGMPHVDLSRNREAFVRLPTRPVHDHHITAADLAKPTIAYCERMKRTRCENWVSGVSGAGGKPVRVTVCKVRGTWRSTRCPTR